MHLNRRIQQVGAPHAAITLDKNQQKSPEAVVSSGLLKLESLSFFGGFFFRLFSNDQFRVENDD